jgi:hypothetical protein
MTRTARLTALCALACTATLAAHEIGTTRVVASVGASNRYRIEIVTDAGSLIDKLEASSGETIGAAADMPAARLEARFAELQDVFDRKIALAFDGVRSRPSMHIAVTPGGATTPPVATITLTGDVPPGARQLAWRYGWTFASYALSVRGAGDQEAATEWLEGGQTSRPIPLDKSVRTPGRVQTAARYVLLGFTHILPKGIDHVLFVLGLFLFTRRTRPLLAQISAFTAAHSITLALSMYHIVRLPPSIVEPLIAVSIAYVAVENLMVANLTRWRVALVFAFGLLHGLGFAGALGELGLPRSEFVTALVGFNVGVEAGQLTVIGAAFAVVGWRWGGREWYRRLVVVPASAFIACIAVYWTIQRITW